QFLDIFVLCIITQFETHLCILLITCKMMPWIIYTNVPFISFVHYLLYIKAYFFIDSFLFNFFHNRLQEVFHLDFLLLLFNKFFFLTLNLVLLLILFTNLRKRSSDCFIL